MSDEAKEFNLDEKLNEITGERPKELMSKWEKDCFGYLCRAIENILYLYSMKADPKEAENDIEIALIEILSFHIAKYAKGEEDAIKYFKEEVISEMEGYIRDECKRQKELSGV